MVALAVSLWAAGMALALSHVLETAANVAPATPTGRIVTFGLRARALIATVGSNVMRCGARHHVRLRFRLVPGALALCLASNVRQPATRPSEDVLAANIDPTVSPGDDFFMYANGGWLKRNPIPPGEEVWGIWSLVVEAVHARQRHLNETAAVRHDR